MGTIKRAFLYVTRKKGKSILLFFILLIMATFVLTGLSIEKSTQEAQANLRETLGGGFEITVDFSDSNPYVRTINDGEGDTLMYTEYPITPAVIDTLKNVNGIKKYNAITHTLVSTDLDIFIGNVPIKEQYCSMVYALAVPNTEDNDLFQSRIRLTSGRHITENENGAAVISKDLAEKNHLKVGDMLSLQGDNTTSVEIIGLYEILEADPLYENIATYEKIENRIFIDFYTLKNLLRDIKAGYDSVYFEVSDPAQLDKILSEIAALSSIDWRAFEVISNNRKYAEAAVPLQEIQKLITTLIIVIALVSAIILSLILIMWGKNRIYETGVFLSLGIGKSKIISQYLAEVLMIAVIAFTASYFTSNTIIDQAANRLLPSGNLSDTEQSDVITIATNEGYGSDITVAVKDDTDLFAGVETEADIEVSTDGLEIPEEQAQIKVGIYDMFRLYLIGVAIIVFSVGVSSLPVMRLKPREILTRMS